jgi:HSP20 family protein
MYYRFDPFADHWHRPMARGGRSFMGADVYRDDDRYLVVVDVPGVGESDVDVTVEKKTMTISVERQTPADEKLELVSRGRVSGEFTRRFYLGDGLDPEGVEASLENGVLTISIPVVEQAKARKVEVGTIRKAIEAS